MARTTSVLSRASETEVGFRPRCGSVERNELSAGKVGVMEVKVQKY